MDVDYPGPGSGQRNFGEPGFLMSAPTDKTVPGARSPRGLHSLPNGPVAGPAAGIGPEQFWDLHGTLLFSLACALLGDEAAALRAVSLGMVDLYSWSDAQADESPEVTLAAGAGCVYTRCYAGLSEPLLGRSMTVPPLMFWLGELARGQRAALALCVFGGHTYQQAATRLDIPAEDAANLLRSGLHDLCRLAASGSESSAWSSGEPSPHQWQGDGERGAIQVPGDD